MTETHVAPIVVTGAASGIGAALTSILRDQGRQVIGLDRVEGPDILVCDLSDAQAIATTVEALPGRLGGLANVAGVPGTAPAATVLRVNVLAPILLSEALVPRLEPTAAIVNVASVAAHRNIQIPDAVAQLMAVRSGPEIDEWLAWHPIDGSAAYDTSKRVLVHWTALQAARCISSEVRCLSVSPGRSRPRSCRTLPPAWDRTRWIDPPQRWGATGGQRRSQRWSRSPCPEQRRGSTALTSRSKADCSRPARRPRSPLPRRTKS